MTSDDDRRVGCAEHGRTGQQVIGGGRQSVLIGPTVDIGSRKLLGCSVIDRTYSESGVRQGADGSPAARYIPKSARRIRYRPR